MSRNIVIGAAQLGPISRSETRSSAVNRMIKLMEEAAENGVELIVFPELALTTFFPRWFIEDQEELDSFFETEVPGPETEKFTFQGTSKMNRTEHFNISKNVTLKQGTLVFQPSMSLEVSWGCACAMIVAGQKHLEC